MTPSSSTSCICFAFSNSFSDVQTLSTSHHGMYFHASCTILGRSEQVELAIPRTLYRPHSSAHPEPVALPRDPSSLSCRALLTVMHAQQLKQVRADQRNSLFLAETAVDVRPSRFEPDVSCLPGLIMAQSDFLPISDTSSGNKITHHSAGREVRREGLFGQRRSRNDPPRIPVSREGSRGGDNHANVLLCQLIRNLTISFHVSVSSIACADPQSSSPGRPEW